MQAASPTTKRKALEMLSPNLIETPTHRARGPYVVPLLRRIQLDGSGGQHGWRVCSVLYLGTSQGCWGQLQQGWRHQDHHEVLHLLSELSRIGMLRNSRPCVSPFLFIVLCFPSASTLSTPMGRGIAARPATPAVRVEAAAMLARGMKPIQVASRFASQDRDRASIPLLEQLQALQQDSEVPVPEHGHGARLQRCLCSFFGC